MLDLLNFSGRKRVPVILQTEAAECGLACLAMVAGVRPGSHAVTAEIQITLS